MGKKNTPDTSMPGGGILRLRPMGFAQDDAEPALSPSNGRHLNRFFIFSRKLSSWAVSLSWRSSASFW